MVLLLAKNFQHVKFSQVDFRIKNPASHTTHRWFFHGLAGGVFAFQSSFLHDDAFQTG